MVEFHEPGTCDLGEWGAIGVYAYLWKLTKHYSDSERQSYHCKHQHALGPMPHCYGRSS